jgi:MFS family permease
VTVSRLTGEPSLGGFGPGLVLVSWSLASLFMGRFMDSRGRALGLRLAFAAGTAGTAVVYAGAHIESLAIFLIGLALVGMCAGTVNLARAGAADMYPPARRARGISLVLSGAAVGAIISQLVFAPMLADVRGGSGDLATPWLAAGALLAAGIFVTFVIRVDPIQIAKAMAAAATGAEPACIAPVRALQGLVRLPYVQSALVAAVLSQAAMAALMSITGLMMVDHGHALSAVSVVMSAHFFGMFALVLVAGQIVDRVGRRQSIIFGLIILTCGALLLLASSALVAMIPALFLVGVGWNLAFVGSTSVLADAATARERGKLLGFNDFVAMNVSAVFTMLFAVVYGEAALVPILGFVRRKPRVQEVHS